MNGPNRRVEFAKVFFLGFFCAVALIALMGQRLSPASPQRIGQYQMRVTDGSTVFVMDSTTGAVKVVAPSSSNNYNPPGVSFDEMKPPVSSSALVEKNR